LDSDIDSELAALDENAPKAAPPAPSAPPAKKEVPDEIDDLDKDTPKEPQKEDKPVKAEKAPETPVRPVKAAELRNAYEALKKRVKEDLEPKVQRYEAKLKELESSEQKPDIEALTSQIEALKKERDELTKKVSFRDYTEDPDFKKNYVEPYIEAWRSAMADLSELQVFNDDGSTRPATQEDMVMIANLPLGEAQAKARDMFGDSAQYIVNHRRIIRDLSEKQTRALEEAKANATEREKQMAAQRTVEHQQRLKLWQEANQNLEKRFPAWFAPAEGDNDGNALLEKGFALADLHFAGQKDLGDKVDLLPPRFRDAIKTTGKLSTQDQVALHALLRNKIASHSRLALQLNKATKRITELEQALAEFEKSEPPGGKGGEAAAAKPGLSVYDEAAAELDAIDAKFQ
jgi:hypothetical protein